MFGSWILLGEIIIATIIVTVSYYKWCFSYWRKKNVATINPKIPFGNSQNPITRKTAAYVHVKNLYDEFKRNGVKHGGVYVFTNPVYLPTDLEYVKNIMTRDFSHFFDRGMYHNEKDEPLSAHLVSLEGQKWKTLRAKLSPTFTSGKMKMMFHIVVGCSEQMLEAMNKLTSSGRPLDIKDIVGCFTTDVIGSCAFGLDCNSFKEESEFRAYGRKVFAPSLKNILRTVSFMTAPKLAAFLGVHFLDPEVTSFFMDVVKKTVAYRELNEVTRSDFMQILIDLKNGKIATESEGGLTIEEIAAQAFVFFLAGFETSSTAMTFCLFELSRNQDIQEKVRREILDVLEKHDGKLSYEAMGDLKYTAQVIDETLRLYPSVPVVSRVCTMDYKLPKSDIILDKGTRVNIPVFGIHRDPEFYPEPEKFDPDRFNERNKSTRHPFSFIPFGEGPRICIGMRFGLMQVKVGLALLLKTYRFKLNDATELPLTFEPNSFLMAVKQLVLLDAEKISTPN